MSEAAKAAIDDLFARRQDRRTPSSITPTGTIDDTPVEISDPAKYAAGALERAHTELANVSEGGRNHALNAQAFSLGRLAAAQLLTEHDVEQCLLDACQRNGLLGEDGEYATLATIRSGLAGGARHPLTWTHTPAQAAPSVRPLHAVPDQDPTEVSPAPEFLHTARVAAELASLRAKDEARDLLADEKAAREFRVPPSRLDVREELLIPEEDVTYAIERLLPTGSNALLTAAFKTGKTTLVGDLAAAHADQTAFLGTFTVAPNAGRLAIFNYELSDSLYRRWLRELELNNPQRLAVLNLRGYRLPLISKSVENWVVQWLAEREVTRWVVDPFARAFTGCGDENDNGHVGRFLDTLDVIKERAGVSELVLPTHTGRMQHEMGQERARGATRLDDWADVRWMLTKDDEDQRFFSANGRDVDLDEELLTYDPTHRRLRFGGPDRRGAKSRSIADRIISAVENAQGGITAGDLEKAVREGGKTSNQTIRDEIKNLVGMRKIQVREIGKSKLYMPPGAVTPLRWDESA